MEVVSSGAIAISCVVATLSVSTTTSKPSWVLGSCVSPTLGRRSRGRRQCRQASYCRVARRRWVRWAWWASLKISTSSQTRKMKDRIATTTKASMACEDGPEPVVFPCKDVISVRSPLAHHSWFFLRFVHQKQWHFPFLSGDPRETHY